MYIPASTYSTLTIRTGGTWRSMNPTQNTTKQAESMMMQTRELDIQRFWRPGTRNYLTIITNSSDVFTNLFSQFCPRIFLSLSSWKRKQISYWSKTALFSQFATWKIFAKKFVGSEFVVWWFDYELVLRKARKSEIGQTIHFILHKYLNFLFFSLNKEHSDI